MLSFADMNSWTIALQIQTYVFCFFDLDKHLISWICSTMKSIKIGVHHMMKP